MKLERLCQNIRLWTIPGDLKRAEWCKNKNIYAAIGENVRIMDRKVPLYAKLIKFHNNIQVGSNVSFVVHDAIYSVLNAMEPDSIYNMTTKIAFDLNRGGIEKHRFQEQLGCIEIMDNVFIGTGAIILGNVRIGPNAIVSAGALVNHDVPENSIVGGVPAKVIGKFADLVEKRSLDIYPEELKPVKQVISNELIQFMWDRFEKDRDQGKLSKLSCF